MFDLSNGVVATKMLTDKAHRDGTYFSCPPLFFAPCCYNFCMFSSIPGRTSTSAIQCMQGYATHTHNPLMQCSICLQFLLWGETGVTLLRWQSIPQFKLKINKYVNSFSVLSLCK